MQSMENHRIYRLPFRDLYAMYIQKAERKQRTAAEVDQIILWLTGYSEQQFQEHLRSGTALQPFLDDAAAFNPKADLVTGVICGVRIENLDHPTMKRIRILDKLIDELAKGRAMAKILRQ